jgi:hypothetical protein|tara:strand:- start:4547 stop:5161 length:615 start_codon:yes stop_codon:yes gene_type:complete
MAQTSTTLSGAKSHVVDISGSDISFTATSGVHTIKSTSTVLTGSGKLAVRDLITVTNTTNNNSTFTVKEVVSTTEFTVEEVVTTETADGSTSTTLDHTGFVTDKSKGDGYYSQPDGVHTVAYQVVNLNDSTDDFNGTIKMQGTLATTPTEDDWFDVSGTTMTSDQSTTNHAYNFTGNYVWVRAKVETTNQSGNPSMVTSILLNN